MAHNETGCRVYLGSYQGNHSLVVISSRGTNWHNIHPNLEAHLRAIAPKNILDLSIGCDGLYWIKFSDSNGTHRDLSAQAWEKVRSQLNRRLETIQTVVLGTSKEIWAQSGDNKIPRHYMSLRPPVADVLLPNGPGRPAAQNIELLELGYSLDNFAVKVQGKAVLGLRLRQNLGPTHSAKADTILAVALSVVDDSAYYIGFQDGTYISSLPDDLVGVVSRHLSPERVDTLIPPAKQSQSVVGLPSGLQEEPSTRPCIEDKAIGKGIPSLQEKKLGEDIATDPPRPGSLPRSGHETSGPSRSSSDQQGIAPRSNYQESKRRPDGVVSNRPNPQPPNELQALLSSFRNPTAKEADPQIRQSIIQEPARAEAPLRVKEIQQLKFPKIRGVKAPSSASILEIPSRSDTLAPDGQEVSNSSQPKSDRQKENPESSSLRTEEKQEAVTSDRSPLRPPILDKLETILSSFRDPPAQDPKPHISKALSQEPLQAEVHPITQQPQPPITQLKTPTNRDIQGPSFVSIPFRVFLGSYGGTHSLVVYSPIGTEWYNVHPDLGALLSSITKDDILDLSLGCNGRYWIKYTQGTTTYRQVSDEVWDSFHPWLQERAETISTVSFGMDREIWVVRHDDRPPVQFLDSPRAILVNLLGVARVEQQVGSIEIVEFGHSSDNFLVKVGGKVFISSKNGVERGNDDVTAASLSPLNDAYYFIATKDGAHQFSLPTELENIVARHLPPPKSESSYKVPNFSVPPHLWQLCDAGGGVFFPVPPVSNGATRLRPLDRSEADHMRLEQLFRTRWRLREGSCPPVHHIYEIAMPLITVMLYCNYRLAVYRTTGITWGLEQDLFHGTSRLCSVGDGGQPETPCIKEVCSLCGILKTSFSVIHAGCKGFIPRFGRAVYTSSFSSKAHKYARDYNSHLKTMLLARVVVGRPCPLTATKETIQLLNTPFGYDSVLGRIHPKADWDVNAVYKEPAILPAYLIVYGF